MDCEPPISEWATERFGEAAPVIRRAVGNALVEAYQTSLDSQHAARLPNKYPLGGNWPAPFVRLVEALRDMPGARVFRPRGSTVDLVSVQGNVFFPFRHATDLNTPIHSARLKKKQAGEVFAGFKRWLRGDSTLFDELDPSDELPNWVRALIEDARREPRLILLPFVGNPDAKRLLAAWWGEAERLEGGYLRWIEGRLEPLPLNAPPPRGSDEGGQPVRPVPLPRQSGPGAVPSRFDAGDLPQIDFPTRPRPTANPSSEAGAVESTVVNDHG